MSATDRPVSRARWAQRLNALHRTVGVAMCLLLVTWCASGVVMVFIGYPRLSEAERLAQQPVLPPLGGAVVRTCFAGGLDAPDGLRVLVVGGRVMCVGRSADGRLALPLDGRAAPPLDAVALHTLSRAEGQETRALGRLVRADQWTLSSAFQDAFPLHHYALEDAQGTEVYLSERSGEVVQRTTRWERGWAWLGAIPHWIYPALLRRERELWRGLVIALALIGLLVTTTGLVTALRSAYRARRSGRGLSPYRKSAFRLHHVLGLFAGPLLCTWLLSGALSLNPLGLSPGSAVPTELAAQLAGGPAAGNDFSLPLERARAACTETLSVRELRTLRFDGVPYYLCLASPSESLLVRADGAPGPVSVRRAFEAHELEDALARVQPPRPHMALAVLREPDDFHYPTHYRPHVPLPVVRVTLDDDERRLFYWDPARAQPLALHGSGSRTMRWLYNGLHSFDFRALYRHPAAWHFVVLTLLGLALLMSLSGVQLSARRLRRRTARTGARRPDATEPVSPAPGGHGAGPAVPR